MTATRKPLTKLIDRLVMLNNIPEHHFLKRRKLSLTFRIIAMFGEVLDVEYRNSSAFVEKFLEM